MNTTYNCRFLSAKHNCRASFLLWTPRSIEEIHVVIRKNESTVLCFGFFMPAIAFGVNFQADVHFRTYVKRLASLYQFNSHAQWLGYSNGISQTTVHRRWSPNHWIKKNLESNDAAPSFTPPVSVINHLTLWTSQDARRNRVDLLHSPLMILQRSRQLDLFPAADAFAPELLDDCTVEDLCSLWSADETCLLARQQFCRSARFMYQELTASIVEGCSKDQRISICVNEKLNMVQSSYCWQVLSRLQQLNLRQRQVLRYPLWEISFAMEFLVSCLWYLLFLERYPFQQHRPPPKTWTFIWLVFSDLRSLFTWCFFLHTEGYIGALKTLNMMNWADTHRHWIFDSTVEFHVDMLGDFVQIIHVLFGLFWCESLSPQPKWSA